MYWLPNFDLFTNNIKTTKGDLNIEPQTGITNFMDVNKTFVTIGNKSLSTLNVVHDYNAETFENQLSDNEGGGEVLVYGSAQQGDVGTLHFLHTNGTWDATDGDDVTKGASQLLGISLTDGSSSRQMLLNGYFKVASGMIEGTPAIGAPVFVSEEIGKFDFTAPSGSSDFVRIVGYCIDIDSSDILLRFKPDNTWVEIA